MKKKTLFVLLVSVFLMLVGTTIFLVTFFTSDLPQKSMHYATRNGFQQIEINLSSTDLTVCSDTKTYIELIGYRESEYFISEENGKLLLSDSGDLIKLSGIGKYLKESRQLYGPKKAILHLSQEDLSNSISLIIKNCSLTLSKDLSQITLHAENSTINAANLSFTRFNGLLKNCNTSISVQHHDNEFSRHIETHNVTFVLNGDERANIEHFVADIDQKILTIEAIGGCFTLQYPSSE